MKSKVEILQLIERTRVVAIVRLDDLTQAVALSRALAQGGIVAQEFTLTNPDALKVIEPVQRALAADGFEAAVGLGSVRNIDEAKAALAAGANFIVSPITRADIIGECRQAEVAVMPVRTRPPRSPMLGSAAPMSSKSSQLGNSVRVTSKMCSPRCPTSNSCRLVEWI